MGVRILALPLVQLAGELTIFDIELVIVGEESELVGMSAVGVVRVTGWHTNPSHAP
jgi:hypothetical protein